MFSKAFLKGAAERALKTFAQALVAYLTAGATGIVDVDWGRAASIAGLATVLSVLTSIISSGLSSPAGSPSLVMDRPTDVVNLPAAGR